MHDNFYLNLNIHAWSNGFGRTITAVVGKLYDWVLVKRRESLWENLLERVEMV